jgi:hypothetical protein
MIVWITTNLLRKVKMTLSLSLISVFWKMSKRIIEEHLRKGKIILPKIRSQDYDTQFHSSNLQSGGDSPQVLLNTSEKKFAFNAIDQTETSAQSKLENSPVKYLQNEKMPMFKFSCHNEWSSHKVLPSMVHLTN